jgi:hypothetical protein
VKIFLLLALSLSIFREFFGSSPVGSFATVMLAPPPYENVLLILRDACVDFAKSEGYVVNQRDLDKKRGRLRLKCAHKTTTKQGRGLRQSTKNNTDCHFRITV